MRIPSGLRARALAAGGWRLVRASETGLGWLILVSQLIIFGIAFPVIRWLFREALRAGGMQGLDLSGLRPGGGLTVTLALIVVIVALAFWLASLQFTALIVLVAGRDARGRLRGILPSLGRVARKLVRPSAIPLVAYLFLLVPLTGFGFTSAFVQGIAIPSFISGELFKSVGTGVGFIVVMVLLVFLNLRFALAVPVFVLSDATGGRALRASWRMTRGIRIPCAVLAAILLVFAGGVLASLALALAAVAPTALADAVVPAASPFVAAYSLGAAQLVGMILSGIATAWIAGILVTAVRALPLPPRVALLTEPGASARTAHGASARTAHGASARTAHGAEPAPDAAADPTPDPADPDLADPAPSAPDLTVPSLDPADHAPDPADPAPDPADPDPADPAPDPADPAPDPAGDPTPAPAGYREPHRRPERTGRRRGLALVVACAVLAAGLGTAGISTLQRLSAAPDTLVLGHRGFSGGGVENTISGLEAADRAGADLVEMDVMQTKDGEFVAMHDAVLSRLADRPDAVKDLTLDELTAITVHDLAGHRDRIPSFADYVTRAGELGMPLLIEIKLGGGETEDHVDRLVAELERLDALERNIYHSLDPASISRLKRLRPDLTVGYTMPFAGGGVPETPADFIVVEEWTATDAMQRAAADAGLGFFAWTVNDEAGIREHLRRDTDGIITDHPDVALSTRSQMRAGTGVAGVLLDAITRFVTVV